MRTFDYRAVYPSLLFPEIVGYLSQIHEFKGQQNLFIEAKPDALSELLDIARIQSTEASNRIEGIYTSDDRLKKLVQSKTMPRTRNEREIAGYRDVLATIHGCFDYDDLAHINEEQAHALDGVTVENNDVLLNITGASVARCCIVPDDILPARVNQHVCILRCRQNTILSKYDLSVLRFINYDIDHHFDAVCRRIDNKIQTRISLTFGESSPTTDHH